MHCTIGTPWAKSRLVFLGSSAAVLLAIIVGTFIPWYNSTQQGDDIWRIAPVSNNTDSGLLVTLELVLTAVDVTKATASFRIQPSACGCLAQGGPSFKKVDYHAPAAKPQKINSVNDPLNLAALRDTPNPQCEEPITVCSHHTKQEIVLMYDTQRKVYKASRHEAMGPADVNVVFVKGDFYQYPFDEYLLHFDLVSYVRRLVNNTQTPWLATEDDYHFVWPVQEIIFHNTVGAFDVITTYDYHNEEFVMQLRRRKTTYAAAVVIMLIQWCLAIVFAVVGFDVAYNKRALELPLCTAAATMIFSLPNLRNTMPNAPPIGCAADMLSLFWAELILATVAFVMLWHYVYRWDGKKYREYPKKESAVDEGKTRERRKDARASASQYLVGGQAKMAETVPDVGEAH